MNLTSIEKIYNKYGKMNQDTRSKGHDAEYMAYVDCVQLLRRDSKLRLSTYMIREAYAMCKTTVLDELGPDGQAQYNKLSKVEFLEFLARIADLFFKESEMEDLHLY